MAHPLRKNVIKFQEEGKSEEEILRTIYTWGTQADIAAVLSISVRRVKYLSKKYDLKKNDKYRVVKRCMNCGEQTHISNFDTVFVDGIPKTNLLCCWSCKREYNKQKYMNKIIEEHWEQERIKREIGTKEDEIEGLRALLK